MARFRSIKNSFLGGQISHTALGRTDHPNYPHSCELLQNMIPFLVGGAYRRPGTLNQDSISSHTSSAPRFIPFIVSRNEAYNLSLASTFSDNLCHVTAYRNIGNFNADLIKSATTGNLPYLVSAAPPNIDDDVFLVQYTQSVDFMYLVHPSYKPQVIKRTAQDTFTVGDFDSGLSGQALAQAYPYLNQNTTAITLQPGATSGTTTLSASAAFFDPKHVGAIFQIDHGSGVVGAALVTAYTSNTQVTINIIVNFSASTAKTEWWEAAWSNFRGWPRTTCIFQQRLAMAGTQFQPDSIWLTQTANYGKFSCLNDAAPALTATNTDGSTFTTTAGYVHFPVDDAEGDAQSTGPRGIQPFRITLSQNTLDQIQWLSPDKELLIGTFDQEWLTSPQNGSFDVGNSPLQIQSHYGSDYLPAVRIGYELIFPLVAQDELIAYQYNYIDQSFFAEPIQLMFDEYPRAEENTSLPGRRKYRQFDWDTTRKTLWCLDTAGNFFGMTRDRKLVTTMWHTHQFGGFDPTKGVNNLVGSFDPSWAMCDGSVVSFSVLPNPLSGVDDVWLCVKRTPAGNPAYSYWQIERMIGRGTVRDSAYSAVTPGNTSTEPLMIDGAFVTTDNGDGTLTYSPGDYLDGYSLTGTYYSATSGIFEIETGAVSGGNCAITSNVPYDYGNIANIVTLGLPSLPIIQPVRLDAGSQIGTAQDAWKRISRAFIRFFKTIGASVGSPPNGQDSNPLEELMFTQTVQNSGQSPEIFTGDKMVNPPTTYDRDGYLYITQPSPLPFEVISIVTEGETFD